VREVTEGLVHVAGNAVLDILLRGAGEVESGGDTWADNVQRLQSPVDAALGGCGAAAAYVLGALGQQVSLNANIGRDIWGGILRAWLEKVEVEVGGLTAANTAVHAIALDDRGRRRSHYYTGEKVDWRASLEGAVPHYLLASGYGGVDAEDLRELAALFSRLRRLGTRVVFDPSPWFAGRVSVADMHALWREVDCLLGTEEELLHWQEADSIEDLTERVLDRGVERVVVKRGPKGAFYAARDGSQGPVSVEEVSAANSVGAGDSFNGRLVYGLCRQESLSDAVFAAAQLATRVVQNGRGALGAIEFERE
jgi:fructokinase